MTAVTTKSCSDKIDQLLPKVEEKTNSKNNHSAHTTGQNADFQVLAGIRPQAEAPPIDKEGTLRNTDWLEADRTKKAEARIRHGNKRLTPPIMTRFDDVNKKEPKGATHVSLMYHNEVS
ncbi:hypothetical protein T4D_9414 [Trichinella pseudospiralis]|uniref:Uncharacterized protein n=1 Tax=Trichinella pseudospiralis TaxID=6337 RepID=A0A0V1FYP9_TRIPS|nr:hypothetical protein T4D_9414 [Trichinella pseudospiralis]